MAAVASTRERLLDSALERFASEGPVATTLDAVRADAGASVGALYHHFPDKAALYDAVRERSLARFQAEFVGELERHTDAEAGVRAIVRLQIEWCAANEAAARLLLDGRPSGAEEMNREFFGRIASWWRVHARYGAVRDLDPLMLHVLWLGPAMELTRHWLSGNARRPTDAQVDALADAAWAALKEG